jgi:hypothetical protein
VNAFTEKRARVERRTGRRTGPGWQDGTVPIDGHLQMIQAVISRLAGQSTTVKGWSITVTGALLGFAATTRTPVTAVIAAWAVLAFAVLDGYYLAFERAYRSHYIAAVAGTMPDWDLTITPPTRRDLLSAVLNWANILLYGNSLLATTAVFGYLLTT